MKIEAIAIATTLSAVHAAGIKDNDPCKVNGCDLINRTGNCNNPDYAPIGGDCDSTKGQWCVAPNGFPAGSQVQCSKSDGPGKCVGVGYAEGCHNTGPTPAPSTDKRQVVGDATFSVTLTGNQKLCGAGGDRCPDNGAEATENCDNTKFSYNGGGKCVLKQDTWCWGDRCVHHDFRNAMKVIEDNGKGKVLGTFQVLLQQGEKLCGQGGNRCPNQGQLALQDCYDTTPGYNAETGECELAKDAWCHEDTGICSPAWGPAPTPTPTPTPTPPPSTDELYVVGDATFPVTLTGDQKLCGAGGNRCPDKGAETPTNCDNLSFSYDFDAKKCILKQDTWCWGDRCVHHDFDNAMKVIEDNGKGKLLGTFQVDLKEGEKLCGQGGNRCPNQGQFALQDCYESTPGYRWGDCRLTKDAWCHEETGICSPRWD